MTITNILSLEDHPIVIYKLKAINYLDFIVLSDSIKANFTSKMVIRIRKARMDFS